MSRIRFLIRWRDGIAKTGSSSQSQTYVLSKILPAVQLSGKIAQEYGLKTISTEKVEGTAAQALLLEFNDREDGK